MLGNHWVSQGAKPVLFKDCYWHLSSFLSIFGLTDLKLSHERFWEKWEVFEILGRVLLGVVVSKLRLDKNIFLTQIDGEVDFNLEAVAGEDDGLLVVAPQPPLNHVRLQLDRWSVVTCFG